MDWTTIFVAGFGILGTLLAPIVSHKLEIGRQAKADAREDRATLRVKLAETYSELDRLQAQANRMSVAAINLANGDKNVPEVSPLDMGCLRANLGLYFPECAEDLKVFDEQQNERSKELREKLTGDPIGAGMAFITLGSAQFMALAAKVRQKLDARADAIRIEAEV